MTAALDYMTKGALVPDSTAWEMVRERGGCLNCRGGFILDGFPLCHPEPSEAPAEGRRGTPCLPIGALTLKGFFGH
jgi:hypothetical protein